jgi:hypothetical protein
MIKERLRSAFALVAEEIDFDNKSLAENHEYDSTIRSRLLERTVKGKSTHLLKMRVCRSCRNDIK